jgi:purine-binding chemotaxis protein CheW
MDERESDAAFDQYLTFRLGEERYAFQVDSVREVIEYTQVTRLPRTTESLRGVINIRGAMIPVFDLKLLFDMGRTEEGTDTSIIVLETRGKSELVAVGVLTDSVQEVINLDRSAVKPPPRLGMRMEGQSVKGIGKLSEGFVTILDIDEIIGETDIPAAEAVAQAV